jgi:3-phenylpropionate/cinnamic acid dioxygenase small subunit
LKRSSAEIRAEFEVPAQAPKDHLERAIASGEGARMSRVDETKEVPDRDGEMAVGSSVLVYRSRGDKPTYDILSGERRDVLRRVNGTWKLARRMVILDNTTLPTHNLSFFL